MKPSPPDDERAVELGEFDQHLVDAGIRKHPIHVFVALKWVQDELL